jgi:hypothetical protein
MLGFLFVRCQICSLLVGEGAVFYVHLYLYTFKENRFEWKQACNKCLFGNVEEKERLDDLGIYGEGNVKIKINRYHPKW